MCEACEQAEAEAAARVARSLGMDVTIERLETGVYYRVTHDNTAVYIAVSRKE